MEIGATDAQMQRKIWLLGHSYPQNWVHVLKEPLDPRHPTRHNIWTPVLDRLQDRVYRDGKRRRLDTGKCYICNAAAKQDRDQPPDWKWKGTSIPARIKLLNGYLDTYKPPLLITFGADVYRFASMALNLQGSQNKALEAGELGERFRSAIAEFDPAQVNVFPLLHAYVARSGWQTAGKCYSDVEGTDYFEYVGASLGGLLATYGKEWPIWVYYGQAEATEAD